MSLIFSSSITLPEKRYPLWIRFKPFGPATTFLISSTARDPYYRKAVSLGIPIVHPSFLIVCCQLSSKEEALNEVNSYFLPRFAGVSVYFGDAIDNRLAALVEENGGTIVDNNSSATHIVVPPGTEPPPISGRQFAVISAWIRESIDLGWMANEANFEARSKGNRIRRRSARMIARKFSKKTNVEPHDTAGALKYKRYQLCRELYVSEINCLKAIDFLIRISAEENYLTPSEVEIIFGSFFRQKQLHSELVSQLGKVLDEWNDYSQIGSIFVELSRQIEHTYVPYFQCLTAALDQFKECKTKNAKFKHFIREKEKDRSIDKQKVEYLLNVPMQQITSRVGVTLKEILSKTDSSFADYVFIKSAIDVIAEVLRKCNNFKKESSESEVIYRQVKHIPARILCSSRRFLSRCQFICVQSPSLNFMVAVELLLFEDVLMITRRNHETQVSCVTLGQKQRRARFVDVYPMTGIREIQLRTRNDAPPLVELTLRRPEGDCEWVLELHQEMEETMKYLNQLVEQVDKVCGRTILIQTISSSFCPKTPEGSKMTPSGFVRSLSSTSAFKNIRSYSQRLRLKRNISTDVALVRSEISASTPQKSTTTPNRSNVNKRLETSTVVYNERSVDRSSPGPQTSSRAWNSPQAIQEVDSEEELVDPYANVKFFSPLKNLTNLRIHSMMDECC